MLSVKCALRIIASCLADALRNAFLPLVASGLSMKRVLGFLFSLSCLASSLPKSVDWLEEDWIAPWNGSLLLDSGNVGSLSVVRR